MPHDPKQNNPKDSSAQKQKNQKWIDYFGDSSSSGTSSTEIKLF